MADWPRKRNIDARARVLLQYLTASQRNGSGEVVDGSIKIVEADSPLGSSSIGHQLGSDGDGEVSGQGTGSTEVYFVLQYMSGDVPAVVTGLGGAMGVVVSAVMGQHDKGTGRQRYIRQIPSLVGASECIPICYKLCSRHYCGENDVLEIGAIRGESNTNLALDSVPAIPEHRRHNYYVNKAGGGRYVYGPRRKTYTHTLGTYLRCQPDGRKLHGRVGTNVSNSLPRRQRHKDNDRAGV